MDDSILVCRWLLIGVIRPAYLGYANVCFWHVADMAVTFSDVRFWVNNGHQRAPIRCLLLTQSGHERLKIAASQNERLLLAACRMLIGFPFPIYAALRCVADDCTATASSAIPTRWR